MINLTLTEILDRFPLRVSITDYCNGSCFFCSNEGMPLENRNTININYDLFKTLIEIVSNNGLRQLSITGGDPTIHPERNKIIKAINGTNISVKYFHTNGIELTADLIESGLKDFSKIAISPNSFDYDVWKKINVKGTTAQFKKLMNNIDSLGQSEVAKKIEIKHVYLNGINSSDEIVKLTLDTCAKYGFKFKFLNFEPIKADDVYLVPEFNNMKLQLERIGCELLDMDSDFRGQTGYMPIFNYSYNGIKGVAIEIGCGKINTCETCYNSNEIFVTPDLKIKPCHASNYALDLSENLRMKNEKGILDSIVESRNFLFTKPGEKSRYWNDFGKK